MRKNVFKVVTAIALTFCIIFAFTGCDSNQDLLDKINDLEQKLEDNKTASDTAIAALKKQLEDADAEMLETLQAKITTLEIANATYKTQIETLTDELETLQTTYASDKAALDAAIKANKDQADALSEDLNTLTASVANATHIERTVIKPADVGGANAIAKTVYVKVHLPNISESVQNVKIGCTLGHGDYSFNYQLITFRTTFLVNNTQLKNFDISVTQALSSEHTVDQTFNTKIHYDSTSLDTYSVTWSEIILYRFV